MVPVSSRRSPEMAQDNNKSPEGLIMIHKDSRNDALVVTGLGSAPYDVMVADDVPNPFVLR